MNRSREQFTAIYGRRPTGDELADAMGIDVAELKQRLDDIAASDLTSLNSLTLSDDDGTIERIHTLRSHDERLDPEAETTRRLAKERFRRAFARLPRREREVAVMLYVKDLTLREVGDVLGVSESRVCQIHAELKRRLRVALEEDSLLFTEAA